MSKQFHQSVCWSSLCIGHFIPWIIPKKVIFFAHVSSVMYFKRDIAELSRERDNNESLACFVDDSGSGSVIALSWSGHNKEHERRDTTHKARYSLGSRLSALVFMPVSELVR